MSLYTHMITRHFYIIKRAHKQRSLIDYIVSIILGLSECKWGTHSKFIIVQLVHRPILWCNWCNDGIQIGIIKFPLLSKINKFSPLPGFESGTSPEVGSRANHWAMMTWYSFAFTIFPIEKLSPNWARCTRTKVGKNW